MANFYFKTADHYVNFFVKHNPYLTEDVLKELDLFYHFCRTRMIPDHERFSWYCKENNMFDLCFDDVNEVLLKTIEKFKKNDQIFSIEFLLAIHKLEKKSGIYKIYDKHGRLMYIGKSVNLASRIQSSVAYRIKQAHTVTYILCNEQDMHILEMYLISKLKPVMNKDGETLQETTFEITVPQESDHIKI